MADEKKTDAGTIWGFAGSEQTEVWSGFCATREEAIAEGRATYPDGFWVMNGTEQVASNFLPDADWIIEDMGQRANDEVGEVAEDWPNVSDEARAELNKLLEAWADKHVVCEMWLADGTAEYIPPETPTS